MRRRCWPVRVRSTSQSQRGELGHPTSQAPAPGPHASVSLSGCCIRVSSACASHRLGWLLWERVKLSGRQAASSWTSRRSWVSAAATSGSCVSFAEAQKAAVLLLEGNKAAEEWRTGVCNVESALLDGSRLGDGDLDESAETVPERIVRACYLVWHQPRQKRRRTRAGDWRRTRSAMCQHGSAFLEVCGGKAARCVVGAVV